jgi:repressor LexA
MLGTNQQLFALRVQGDSMIDASVLDGDIVIIRHQNTANDGDMVAAWIDGDDETTLKFLYREGRNVRLQPASPNPEFKPIIRPAEKVRINGKVVSVIRMLH